MTLAVDGSHLLAALIVFEDLIQELGFEVGAVTRGVIAVAGFAATVTNQLAVPGRTILELKLLNVVSA